MINQAIAMVGPVGPVSGSWWKLRLGLDFSVLVKVIVPWNKSSK